MFQYNEFLLSCIIFVTNTLDWMSGIWKHHIFGEIWPKFHFEVLYLKKKCFQCNTSKWNIGQISPKIWIFQIPDIQSRVFVTKVMYLNINSLFWNIYDVFERKSRIWTYIWLSASSPYQHPWATVYPCLAIL